MPSWAYCGDLEPQSTAWIDHGFGQCFLTTVSSLSLFGFMFIFGGSVSLVPAKRERRSQLSPFELSFFTATSWFIAALHLAHGIFNTANSGPTEFIIVCDTLLALGWLFCLPVLSRARKGKQPLHPLLFVFFLMALVFDILALVSWQSHEWYFHSITSSATSAANFGLFIASAATNLVNVIVSIVHVAKRFSGRCCGRQRDGYSLLPQSVNTEGGETLPSAESAEAGDKPSDDKKSSARPERDVQGSVTERQGTTFADLSFRIKVIWPFLWPTRKYGLQLRVLVCLALLASGRVVNLYVPLYYKQIVDKLTPPSANTSAMVSTVMLALDPWHNSSLTDTVALEDAVSSNSLMYPRVPFPVALILIYVAMRFLSGGAIKNIWSFLWIDVQQYSTRMSRLQIFQHLHALSLRWHLSRKTGEVLRMVDRGTDSIASLLQYIIFNIFPTIADIAIACVYFTTSFGPYFGLIVFLTMFGYIYVTVSITEWRTKFRRAMNTSDNKLRQMAVDSLLNFETVKYFNAEGFEKERYDDKMQDFLLHSWRSLASLNALNIAQSCVIAAGLLAGTMLCGYEVSQGHLNVGDFVLYITYIMQLYTPLNFFGTYYRMIQANLIDMENMFDLLQVKAEIKDDEDAPELVPHSEYGCDIRFENVQFAYDPAKPILKGLSFHVPAGKHLAIVGSTGSGKSTIMKLLFRFYDVQGGRILVDGQDIRHVTQDSLRRIMGVVPQDTVLFHDTVLYNIKYGRATATDEQAIEAAKAAEIHDSVMTFPDKYETVVGERGLKLSGGEKQRVAIARAMLKAPRVILLDEATSALDTQTERSIQSSLARVCQGRTNITIAHRLSTIVHADSIIVLKDGEIIEQGTHDKLMAQEGKYFDMWREQLEANEAGKDALPADMKDGEPASEDSKSAASSHAAHSHGHGHGHS